MPYLLLIAKRLSFVEPQISNIVNFTPCEELIPIRHLKKWQMCNLRTVNLEFFLGVKFVLKFNILWFLTCEESVPNPHICEKMVSNYYM